MKLFAFNIQAGPPLRYRPVLMALVGILSGSGSWAADPSTPASSTTPRATVDRLLASQQAEKQNVEEQPIRQ